jgi:hypothetical protein
LAEAIVRNAFDCPFTESIESDRGPPVMHRHAVIHGLASRRTVRQHILQFHAQLISVIRFASCGHVVESEATSH